MSVYVTDNLLQGQKIRLAGLSLLSSHNAGLGMAALQAPALGARPCARLKATASAALGHLLQTP